MIWNNKHLTTSRESVFHANILAEDAKFVHQLVENDPLVTDKKK